MALCIVASSPKWVPRETVQRTRPHDAWRSLCCSTGITMNEWLHLEVFSSPCSPS
jgi:hypothetical protein